ncbi:MAG: PD-(D/E)XK nuclease family transposase [Fibrobacter sp.]|nr:PD-(D/E)XK nuclease family transposase [Fibrobacter sp.]
MAKRKPLKDCIVKPGEKSPFANLLVDLAFKKAFDPDKPSSRENLVNLLNDLLEPQLKRPIKNVWTRNVAKNLSGSRESRTAIFDLHCEDDAGNLIEIVFFREVLTQLKLRNFIEKDILRLSSGEATFPQQVAEPQGEVQIRKQDHFLKRLAFYASEIIANQAEPGDEWDYDVKPTYVIALTQHTMFGDDRIVHRATVTDLDTGEQFLETFNFTVIELSKVPFFIEPGFSSLRKWLFFLRFLDKLKELPAELDEKKFKQLTESSKVSKFSKEEFEAYQKVYHEKWDHNVMVKAMREQGVADSIIAKVSGLSVEEIARL